jgi:hypothetical protein
MPAYRVYTVTTDGHIAGPAQMIECADEQEAVGNAAHLTNGKSVELWDGARFIVRFPSDEK